MSDAQPQDDIIDIEHKVIGENNAEAPKSRRLMVLKILPYAALAVLCLVAGGWFYRDLLAGYLPSDQVQALSIRVATFEAATNDNKKRVDAVVALTEELKTKLSAAQAAADKSTKQNADTAVIAQNSAGEIAGLKQDLEKLSVASNDLQSKLATGVSVSATDPALATRMAQLEKQLTANVAGVSSGVTPDLSSNLKTLKTQIAQGQEFAATLAPMARALPSAPGLDVLGTERAGLANAASLATELDSLRVSLPKPQVVVEETGIWASIKYLFSNLVRVRGQAGDDWATASAKASAFAAAGDLDQASAALSTSGATPPPALKTWTDKAQRRVKLEKALDSFAASLNVAGLTKE